MTAVPGQGWPNSNAQDMVEAAAISAQLAGAPAEKTRVTFSGAAGTPAPLLARGFLRQVITLGMLGAFILTMLVAIPATVLTVSLALA
ncbi:MAG: hypothetical protein ACRCVA_30520 [Phreatobacter sp.]